MGASSAAIDSAYGQEQAQASDTQTELLKTSIIAGKYKEIGRLQAHALPCNRGIPACVVTVVTVVTVNCMVRIASSAAIVSACGQEHPKYPAHRINRCITRKYKGFRRALCHAADEVPACVVTVVTVVTVNCMVRIANGAAIVSACGGNIPGI